MPIRVVPFEAIDVSLIESLKEDRVREDRTLDFKRELDLTSRDTQSEFAKDVTAFANSSGGTLLYGVTEGKGEDEGLIVALPGLELKPDAVHRQIDNLLRNSVDERPMGVLHRAVPRPDGRYYYVVRVPPSPLAPHMVTTGQHKSKFFVRGSTTSYPMDARQIKETALKAATAFDRALVIIEDRRRALIRRASSPPEEGGRVDHPTDDFSQLMLHVVPLFPSPGGFTLAEDRVVDRLARVSILGWSSDNYSRRFTLDGLYVSYGYNARAAYLRSGAVEFQEYGIRQRAGLSLAAGTSPQMPVRAWQIEEGVLRALDGCAGLTADGLLPLPLVICLALSGVQGSTLLISSGSSRSSPEAIAEDVVPLTPIVLHAWDEVAATQVRGLFDEMYQAWGLPRSTNYEDSKRIWWGSHDRVRAPKPAFWTTGWEAEV